MPISMSRNSLIICLILFNWCFHIQYSFAATVRVIDEQGRPFANAVISSRDVLPVSDKSTVGFSAVMDQMNKQFSPEILIVDQGTTVTFPNSDNIRHHVYSFSEPKPFEIKLYANDNVPPILFDKPGIVVLGCNIHDSMLGYIYVKENGRVWTTNAQGIAEIEIADGEFSVWHPEFSINHLQRMPAKFDTNRDYELTFSRVSSSALNKNTFGSGKFNRQ